MARYKGSESALLGFVGLGAWGLEIGVKAKAEGLLYIL